MEGPGGGFFATLDADSEGHEGRFYAWDLEELRDLLPPDEYPAFAARFGLDRPPNFEGKWHLHCFKSMTAVAEEIGAEEAAAGRLIDQARARLLPVRNRRVWPARDEKILTSWNGLAIAGLAAAARSLRRPELAESAARAADFLHEHCWYQGRLLAVHKDGRSRFPAYLDDHASLAWGLLELVQARWHAPHLAWAIDLTEAMLRHFEDRDSGGFFFTADDHEQLILRPKTFSDDATPAGNGVAARLLVRLGFLLAEPRYTGRVSVPVLWDKKRKTIVNNESPEIIRMLNSAFDAFTNVRTDYYPEPLRAQIDKFNDLTYPNINNGVYRAGFATSQAAYEQAFRNVFDTLEEIEQVLSQHRYLVGNTITEADWRLFCTLIRFDAVYYSHFKCNWRHIYEYPNLSNYLRDLYQVPGVAETVSIEQIKRHYYGSQRQVNPTGIVPVGPQLDFAAPHDRGRFGA